MTATTPPTPQTLDEEAIVAAVVSSLDIIERIIEKAAERGIPATDYMGEFLRYMDTKNPLLAFSVTFTLAVMNELHRRALAAEAKPLGPVH